MARLEVTAHKLRLGEGPNSYVDICTPFVTNNVKLSKLDQTLARIITQVKAYSSRCAEQGDTVITFKLSLDNSEV